MHNCRQGGALNASVIWMRKPPFAEIYSLFRTKHGAVSCVYAFLFWQGDQRKQGAD